MPRLLPFASGVPRLKLWRQCEGFMLMTLRGRFWPFRPLKVARMDRVSLEALCPSSASAPPQRRATFRGEGYRPTEIIIIIILR